MSATFAVDRVEEKSPADLPVVDLPRLLRNSGWVAVVQVAPLILRVLLTPMRTHLVSPSGFGDIALWTALAAMLTVAATWPATGLTRLWPGTAFQQRARVTRAWLHLSALFAMLGAGACAAWAIVGGPIWLLVAAVVAAEAAIGAATSYARVLDRFTIMAAIATIAGAGGLLLGTVLLVPFGPQGALLGWLVADLIALGASVLWLRCNLKQDLGGGVGSRYRHISSYAGPLAIGNCAWLLAAYLDRPLLGGLVRQSDLGRYAFAYALVAAPLTGAFSVLSSTTWNQVVEVFEVSGSVAAKALLDVSARLYAVLAVPVSIALLFFGRDVVAVMGPASYRASAVHIPWLVVGLWCAGLIPYRNHYLQLVGRSGASAVSGIAAAVANLICLVVLVPKIGAVGASIATAAGYGCGLAIASIYTRRDGRIRSSLQLGCHARIAFACIPVALLGLAVRGATFGVLRYVVVCLTGCLLLVIAAAIEGTAIRAVRRRSY
jgi:O-antigen/teichoic acid export membrane protein